MSSRKSRVAQPHLRHPSGVELGAQLGWREPLVLLQTPLDESRVDLLGALTEHNLAGISVGGNYQLVGSISCARWSAQLGLM